MLNLLIEEVQDIYARDNFRKLEDLSELNPFLKGAWVLKELVFTQAETNLKIPHGLPFTPQDFITTFVSNSATFAVNYDLVNATNIDITVSAACRVRLLMGRYTNA